MKQISLCERLNFRISASEASLYIKTHIRPRHHSLHPFRTELVPHIQKWEHLWSIAVCKRTQCTHTHTHTQWCQMVTQRNLKMIAIFV